MADRQLDLFGEAVADAPATGLPNEISETRVPVIPRSIVDAVLDDDSGATKCHGSVTGAHHGGLDLETEQPFPGWEV